MLRTHNALMEKFETEDLTVRKRKIRSRNVLSDEETRRLIQKDKAEHPEDFRELDCKDLSKAEFLQMVAYNSARVIDPIAKWL